MKHDFEPGDIIYIPEDVDNCGAIVFINEDKNIIRLYLDDTTGAYSNVTSNTELEDDVEDQESFGEGLFDKATKIGTLKELHDLCLEIT